MTEMTVTDPFTIASLSRADREVAQADNARAARSRDRTPWPGAAMEGATIEKVEVRHRGLRWPIVKGFEKRLEARRWKVSGGGRNICWPICHRATC